MKAAAKNKQQFFKGQFSKYISIANPKLKDQLLEEVNDSFLYSWQLFLKHN
jgi:hypothetical protein